VVTGSVRPLSGSVKDIAIAQWISEQSAVVSSI
jgi:hypothetical protein